MKWKEIGNERKCLKESVFHPCQLNPRQVDFQPGILNQLV